MKNYEKSRSRAYGDIVQEKAQHTPTPWHVEVIRGCWKVLGSHGDVAFDDGSAYGEYSDTCKPETRDFIVRAVNNYQEAIEALKLAWNVRIIEPEKFKAHSKEEKELSEAMWRVKEAIEKSEAQS